MRMVNRIGLVVALACVAVPATLMGSTTYFFINENPDYSDSLVGVSDTAVWQASIVEVGSDSAVSAPDGYETTDTAYIHSLGLLAPSELTAQTNGMKQDWHRDFWANREWGSQISWSYTDNSTRKLVQVLSATCRITVPGMCAVKCTTWSSNANPPGPRKPVWTPDWVKSNWNPASWWRVQLTNSFRYQSIYTYHWEQDGYHNWGSLDTLHTVVSTVW